MIIVSGQSNLSVSHSEIFNISSKYSGFLISYENFESEIIISNCFFKNIVSVEDMFDISKSIIFIINSTFDSIQNLNIRSDSSSIYLNEDIIQNIDCKKLYNGCIFSCTSNSIIEIKDSLIKNIENMNLQGNMYLQNSIAFFENLIVDNTKANKYKGSCLYSIQSNLTILNSKFSSYDYNCLYLTETDTNLTNLIFDNTGNKNSKSFGLEGAVYCDSCSIFMIENSFFLINWYAKLGGSLIITNNLKIFNNNLSIKNCLFDSNEAYSSGGAIYLSNVKGKIISNNFTNNLAGFGGALYYYTNCKRYFYDIINIE